MDKIKLHVPTTQFGYIEVEKDFMLEKKEELYKEAVDDFKMILSLWNNPEGSEDPKYLGQTMIQNGHVYKAVRNEGSEKLYWLIEKV